MVIIKMTSKKSGKCCIGKMILPAIVEDIKENGIKSFTIEILGSFRSLKHLNHAFKSFIDEYQSLDPEKGYNSEDDFRSSPKREFTEEHRRKLSDALKGRKLSEEHRAKIAESLIGNKRPLGHVASVETRRRMRRHHVGFLGKKHKQSTKHRISNRLTGRKRLPKKGE